MVSTGIVRRIDDLGRIVIPKAIRQQLKIKENDPLEIWVNNDGILSLVPYKPEKLNFATISGGWREMEQKERLDFIELLKEHLTDT